jgi:hypothetical protein
MLMFVDVRHRRRWRPARLQGWGVIRPDGRDALSTAVQRAAAFAAAVLATVAAPVLAAPDAATAAPGAAVAAPAASGYVRLAHLSPDTPEVDVYLNSQSGAIPAKVFRGVGYGAMSDYQSLPVGGYTVAMRPSGAPASTPAVLTTQVSVAAGRAYTVAGVGRYADLGLRVLTDDISLPYQNQAKVRIVQASVRAPVLDVSVKGGPLIAEHIAFATTTAYQLVQPGTWQLQVQTTSGGAKTQLSVRLEEGSVYSLLILDAAGGGLVAQLKTDASRRGGVPVGGVDTGAGGRTSSWLLLAGVGALAVALMVGLGAVVYRRRTSRVL